MRALVTTRAFGDLKTKEARARLRAHLPAEPAWFRQVHGIEALDARSSASAADASCTKEKNAVCAVMIADCMPVFFTDGTQVAVAHAGWRGLAAGVIESAIDALGIPGERLLAWLGPAIGPRVYEVGDEVRAAFLARDGRAGTAFRATRPGHWLLDLYAVGRQRLQAKGVGRVFGGGFCTYSQQDKFFSFRKNQASERMAAAIWLS
ncbi:MAG TPA: peptidoglycan editing factor PgeF [Burkholderiales bacterium]|nr:peptidoglycan editing factor PgeF [Burkholderiales bacterium]